MVTFSLARLNFLARGDCEIRKFTDKIARPAIVCAPPETEKCFFFYKISGVGGFPLRLPSIVTIAFSSLFFRIKVFQCYLESSITVIFHVDE